MGCTSSQQNGVLTAANPSAVAGAVSPNSSSKSNPLSEKEIAQRIESAGKTQLLELGGVTYRYAWMSQRGYYPDSLDKDNQDAYQIIPNFGKSTDCQAFFAIFDGHGRDGHHCARYARDKLSKNILDKLDRVPPGSCNSKTIKQALNVAHYLTNEAMHTDKRFDDSLSGTTAISILFRGKTMYVSNVGDSRAIIVSAGEDGRLVAKPMSSDQTPYRRDERERVKKFGARVLSMDQIEGLEPQHENWGDLNLGEDIDEGGDPPRVWSPNGDYPGTAFTRSLGDLLAEECGVIPEPEIIEREVTPADRFIVIASDGVFEFLTNQMVGDMLARYSDPLDACKALVEASYNMWLQYEIRTDDISVIALYINDIRKSTSFEFNSSFYTGERPAPPPRVLHDSPPPPQDRPVRRVMSREKKKHMITLHDDDTAEDVLTEEEIAQLTIAKTPEETEVIMSSMRNNFLFQHLNASQRSLVVDLMQPLETPPGTWVIHQGDAGDAFYVVDSGRFEVRVRPPTAPAPSPTTTTATATLLPEVLSEADRERIGGAVVHVYESGPDQHPGFGELSLMYGKPRAASVISLTPGKLWSLNRSIFRRVVLRPRDYRKDILQTLKKVDLLKCLHITQMQRLMDLLGEETYSAGENIITQGEAGDRFYLLIGGEADCTINVPPPAPAPAADASAAPDASAAGDALPLPAPPASPATSPKVVMHLTSPSYFGERALLESKPRAANVTCVTACKVLYIDKKAFEEVLGPLADIVSEDRKRRELLALEALEAPKVWEDLTVNGLVLTDTLGPITLAACKGKEVTLRSILLSDAQKDGLRVNHFLDGSSLPTSNMPNLPRVWGTLRTANAVHLVYPLSVVADMSTFIRTHSEGLSNVSYVAYAMYAIVSALEVLHEGSMVYRAIQPESIYIDSEGRIVLMDYRFCKLGVGSTKTFTLCGASDYLSPEQIAQSGHTQAVDMWALGVLLYELTVGAHPFSSTSEVATYSRISSFGSKSFPTLKFPDTLAVEVKSLINQLLVPTPEARIATHAVKKHPFLATCSEATLQGVSPLLPFARLEKQEILSEGIDTKVLEAFHVEFTGDKAWLEALDL